MKRLVSRISDAQALRSMVRDQIQYYDNFEEFGLTQKDLDEIYKQIIDSEDFLYILKKKGYPDGKSGDIQQLVLQHIKF